jgi:hypothetical protein
MQPKKSPMTLFHLSLSIMNCRLLLCFKALLVCTFVHFLSQYKEIVNTFPINFFDEATVKLRLFYQRQTTLYSVKLVAVLARCVI